MKTKLLCLILLCSCTLLPAQWSQVGSTQFTNFANEADFTFDSSGTPYVVYDDAVAGTPVVQKFDGTNWVTVGNSNTWGTVDATLLAIAINPVDDQPWVTWKNGSSFINVYKFDGTNWVVDNPVQLYVPTNNAPLAFVFNASNEPVIYHHKVGGTSSQRDYFRLFKQASWAGSNIWTGFSSSFIVTTDKNGESILNELSPSATSSQIRALNASGGLKFTVSASNVGVKRFNKLSMINNYWVGNDIINGTAGITFGLSSSLSLPQPLNTASNTGNYLKLVERTQGNLMYLMFSDASNQLQIQRYRISSSQWSVLPALSLNTSASGYIVDIEVNEVDNNLYVLYQDSGRISMQMFTEEPALSRYYVNANVSGGDGSGDSWVNAMSDLQSALEGADSNTSEIWVASGTYNPGTSRTASFNIGIDDLQLLGGFSGSEVSISDRNIPNNPTILSGDLNNDDTGVGFVNTTRNDNSYHILDILDASNVVIDGFQIKDGHANGTGTNAYGGAVLVRSLTQNLKFRNCEFNQNIGLTGGAIRSYLNVDTSMSFENCTFFNNISRYGSGIYFLVNNNRTVSLDITNCLFYQNISVDQSGSALGYTGSGLWARANTTGSNLTTTLNSCTFANNLDRGNTPSSTRGTLALSRRTDGSSTHNATINNSIFYFNDQGVSGATGVSVNSGHVSLPNQVFVNNAISEDSFSNLLFLTNTSSIDPLFTDPNTNDFTLQLGSPAIDTGDDNLVPATLTYDLLFNQRIHNSAVDMGVYEYGASSTLSTNDFEFDQDKVRVFPNPTSSIINIVSTSTIKNVGIYNMLGSIVLESTNRAIDVSKLQSGYYLMKVEDVNGSVITKKFIRR